MAKHAWIFLCFCVLAFFNRTLAAKCADWTNYPYFGSVSSIIRDSNLIWIGTSNGLYKFDCVTKDTIPFNKEYPCSLFRPIRCMAKASDGSIWIGGRGFLLQMKDSICTIHDTAVLSFPHCIIEDSKKNIWVGYFEGSGIPYPGGLYKFDGSKWTEYTKRNSGLRYNGIASLLENSPGKILVGMQYGITNGPGLLEYDGQTWYELPNTPSYLSTTCMVKETNGTIWIGTSNGIAIFDGRNWQLKDSALSYPYNFINCLLCDSQGAIWIGAYNGLSLYQNDGTFLLFDTNNSGLPINEITCLANDLQNNIWVGTAAGLTSYNRVTSLKNIGDKKGRASGSAPDKSSFLDGGYFIGKSPAIISLYDVTGRLVGKSTGVSNNGAVWKPKDMRPGMYIIQFESVNDSQESKTRRSLITNH